MKNITTSSVSALLFLGVYFCTLPLLQTFATPPASQPRATITFADNTAITIRGDNQAEFRSIGILPGESLTIQLQLPLNFANTLMDVQAMDGGQVSGDVTIAADGSAVIAFQAGAQPGLYRLLLSALGRSATLQFSVPNSP